MARWNAASWPGCRVHSSHRSSRRRSHCGSDGGMAGVVARAAQTPRYWAYLSEPGRGLRQLVPPGDRPGGRTYLVTDDIKLIAESFDEALESLVHGPGELRPHIAPVDVPGRRVDRPVRRSAAHGRSGPG